MKRVFGVADVLRMFGIQTVLIVAVVILVAGCGEVEPVGLGDAVFVATVWLTAVASIGLCMIGACIWDSRKHRRRPS